MNGGVVTLTSNQVQQALGYGQIYVQAIYQDGTFSGALGLGWLWMAPEEWEYDPQRREVFVDARQHLKENLRFLLRSATVTRPFSYTSGFDTDPAAGPYTPDESFLDYPESYFARHASPTNYEYAGFHYYSPYQDYAVMTPTRPVKENYFRPFEKPDYFQSRWAGR